jgi:hypothetical protein
MNNNTATTPTHRSTQRIFLDELESMIANGWPDLQVGFDYTAGNQGRICLYRDLELVAAYRFDFQSNYARIDAVDDTRHTGWGNGLPASPRRAFDDLVSWIDNDAG